MPCAEILSSAYLITNHAPPQIVSGYENIQPQDTVIAVDAGLETIHKLGLAPSIIIGDLDSVSNKLLAQYREVPRIKHPCEKNETDTELAISWCLKQKRFAKIVICNDLEGRFDHALALIQNLLSSHRNRQQDISIYIDSGHQLIMLLKDETTLEGRSGQVLSLIPLSQRVVFNSSTGLKYPLNNLILMQHKSRGISNVLTSNHISISKTSGTVLAVISMA